MQRAGGGREERLRELRSGAMGAWQLLIICATSPSLPGAMAPPASAGASAKRRASGEPGRGDPKTGIERSCALSCLILTIPPVPARVVRSARGRGTPPSVGYALGGLCLVKGPISWRMRAGYFRLGLMCIFARVGAALANI